MFSLKHNFGSISGVSPQIAIVPPNSLEMLGFPTLSSNRDPSSIILCFHSLEYISQVFPAFVILLIILYIIPVLAFQDIVVSPCS